MLNRIALAIVVCLFLAAFSSAAEELNGLPLIFSDDFEQGADHWQQAPTDAKAWKITEMEGRGKVYDLFQHSDYKPPHRSPSELSLLNDIVVGDFVLLIKARNTAFKAGGHRDCCIFFGYQDGEHFYYAHQGLVRDAISNQLLKVDKGPRKPIGQTNAGSPWGDERLAPDQAGSSRERRRDRTLFRRHGETGQNGRRQGLRLGAESAWAALAIPFSGMT